LQVGFSLPSAGRAELAVYDVRGRRVVGQVIQAAQAGPQSLTLAAGGVLRAGVYVLRLSQGKRAVSRKFTVAR